MKKIYAFLAAALMSVSMFAAKDVVPSDADLANYYEPGQVCVCIYVPLEISCNQIAFAGTYNLKEGSTDWSTDVNTLAKFQPVEGFDGWYVVAVDDATDPLAEGGIQGKPAMLDNAGQFNWDYQVGAATVIRGGVQVVQGAYGNEIDLKNYSKDVPNVYTIDAWKVNPCTGKVYTVAVINDGCDGLAVPFFVGGATGWAFKQMQVDVAKSQELQAAYYYYSFFAAEGAEYQIASGLMDATGAIVAEAGWDEAAYLQELNDDVWSRINGGANFVLGEETTVVYDIRVDTLRWARCAAEDAYEVAVSMTAPAGAPAAGVDIIGSFDGWAGTIMTLENGVYTATISATASQVFKFRQAGTWDNEILVADPAAEGGWKGFPDTPFGSVWQPAAEEGKMVITLDLSDPAMYAWKVPFEEGIEEVVLTEQAQKVIVDGVLYIVRDNKMFNVQGTQVR